MLIYLLNKQNDINSKERFIIVSWFVLVLGPGQCPCLSWNKKNNVKCIKMNIRTRQDIVLVLAHSRTVLGQGQIRTLLWICHSKVLSIIFYLWKSNYEIYRYEVILSSLYICYYLRLPDMKSRNTLLKF